MKIGLSLSGDQVTLEETLQFARQAEANGFDSIWVPEAWRDAFVPLTAIALQNQPRSHWNGNLPWRWLAAQSSWKRRRPHSMSCLRDALYLA